MCKFVVNVKEILTNLTKAKAVLPKNTKVCGVVKANAYGFGSVKICRLLASSVDYFAVARLGEFLKIKELALDKPCLILTPMTNKENAIAIKNGAEITINSFTNLSFIENVASKNNILAKVHIKLDTGMSRYGIKSDSKLVELLEKLKSSKHIEVVGAYSHLFDAENEVRTKKQREKFIHFQKIIRNYGFKPIFHLANSYGLKNKENCFDMVRLGFDLYSGTEKSEHKFVATIREIKSLVKGEVVSYNGRFRAKKDMKIAICDAGYADGVNRLLSNKGNVLINGQFARILGNICMDSFMVDITDIPQAKLDDEVVIFGKSGENYISVCELAQICGTIPYEIYTGISERVKRIYKWGDRQIVKSVMRRN